MQTNRQIIIDHLPDDKLGVDNYRLETSPMPSPGDGELLCRTLVLTLGAGTRAGLQGSASYAGAPKNNIVMNGTAVARVEQSRADGIREGDLVVCPAGWQDYSVQAAGAVQPVADDIDPAHYLGALGTNGLTAYFGLLEVGQPSAGETVLVSAAAGSVGHLAGQIAKIKGCKTVGLAGSDEKCSFLTDELGFDRALCYKSEDIRSELKAACDGGVDVYFDNTGGDILGMALFRMNNHGRIACCGVVSQYDTSNPAAGPRGIPGLLVNKRIRMQGFLVFDFATRYDEARAELKSWIKSGELRPLNDTWQDLESAPAAFVDLLAGGNIGTRMVQVAE